MAPAFLDTNVLLRHLLGDDPVQSPGATSYLGRVERGELRVRTADAVVFETVFTLERRYRQPKAAIRDTVLPLLELSGVILPGKRYLRQVFDLYVALNLPFADAYHAVLAKRFCDGEVASFGRHFERIPGVTRIEPS